MRDRDQRHGPLAHVDPVQVDRPILGNHPMYVAARGDHAGPVVEPRHNPRDRPARPGRGHGHDRLAAATARRAADEVHLPADAAVEPEPDRVGADLPGQVDLQTAIDGDHVVVLGDDERVIGVIDRV